MIEMHGVSKRFGDLLAVDDLSLTVQPGEVFGFIGPNGAGKSTTMKILAGLIRPDAGDAKVCGHDVIREGDAVRRKIGYMPDFLGVYQDLTVDEYLQFFAAAYSVSRKDRRSTIDGVLELTDLTEKKSAMVDSLSRGMQQRLGVARVLLHDPAVLLLDEPASGLDPRARIEMRELLAELGRMGKALMVSSHILSELGELCTNLGIIEQGRLLFNGTTEEALATAGGGGIVKVRLAGDEEAARVSGVLLADERVLRVTADGVSLTIELVEERGGHRFLLERLVGAGAAIESFEPRKATLEDAFLRLTKGRVQ